MTAGRELLPYDEQAIAEKLRALPLALRVLFACACAERLMPAYHWFCDRIHSGDFVVVRQALDAAWCVGLPDTAPAPPEISRWRARVEALVLSDDEDKMFPALLPYV